MRQPALLATLLLAGPALAAGGDEVMPEGCIAERALHLHFYLNHRK